MKTGSQSDQLINAMQRLIMMMHSVDDTCLSLTANISKRDLDLITHVGERESMIMREIADHLEVPVSTTTGIVDKLVSNGYLERKLTSDDRRSIRIVLSDHGLEVYKTFNAMRQRMAQRIMSELEADEVVEFVRLLEKIAQRLHNYIPAG